MGGSLSKRRREMTDVAESEGSHSPNSLYDAIIRNDLALCARVVQGGTDLNEELKFSYGNADGRRTFCRYIRTYALHLACVHRRNAMVELLLAHGACPSLEDYMGRRPMSLVLLYWPRIHYFGSLSGLNKRESEYQLYLKEQHGKSESCLKALLGKGVNPDETCARQDQRCPLHLCAKYNLVSAIKILVQEKSDLEVRDANRLSPLTLAAKLGNTAALQVLLQSGANPNAQDDKGCAPSHYAACVDVSSRACQLRWIVEYGADLSLQDQAGNTCLHYAAKSGRENCIEVLLNNGANPDIRNAEGETPLFVLLNQTDNGSCAYAFRRLLAESRQPSILNADGATPSQLDTPLYAPYADDLLRASTNPSMLQWLARNTVRTGLGRGRLNATDIMALPCPNFIRNYVLLTSNNLLQ